MSQDALPASTVIRTYDRYSSVYDLLFGKVLQNGRATLAGNLKARPGQTLLEIGVGSGLMLPLYPRSLDVLGVDISEGMLRKARAAIESHNLTNARVRLVDPSLSCLPQAAFDHVVLPYVYSATPNPAHLIERAFHAAKPGGSIWILNHFSHPSAWKLLERPFRPFASLLGFRTDFSYTKFVTEQNWDILEEYKVNLFSLSRLLHIRNSLTVPGL